MANDMANDIAKQIADLDMYVIEKINTKTYKCDTMVGVILTAKNKGKEKMRTVKEVLRDRDDKSEREIDELYESVREQIRELIEYGGTLEDAEDIIATEFGLEPDYLLEFI